MADRTFIDEDGESWDSTYEHDVYRGLELLDVSVRRCIKGSSDTISYTSEVRQGVCMDCQSTKVVQERTYTPDFCIYAEGDDGEPRVVFVEAKGYWKADKRRLLRSVLKSNPHLNLLLVFQKDGWVTKGKSKYTDYAARYLKSARCLVWDNRGKMRKPVLPEGFVWR